MLRTTSRVAVVRTALVATVTGVFLFFAVTASANSRYLFLMPFVLFLDSVEADVEKIKAESTMTSTLSPVACPAQAVWTEQQHPTATDTPVAGDSFGYASAISGDTAVIGAVFDDISGNNDAGSAYVYVRSGTAWTQQAKLTASDGAAGDRFGVSVAIDGDTIVVGAFGDDSDNGSAYVFTRSGTLWTQQGSKLTASDGASGDQFGVSVGIDGDSIIIGARNHDLPGPVADVGGAYVFTRSAGVWSQQQKITAEADANTGEQFGNAVGISGETVVVGARFDDAPGPVADSGAAYVFTRSGMVWSRQSRLLASDPMANDRMGYAVAISGDTIVAASDSNDAGATDAGAAYVFTRSSGAWTQQQKLTAFDGAASDFFGQSIALDGDRLVVGSFADDTGAGVNAGSAYVFRRCTSSWIMEQHISASDGAPSDSFGVSAAIEADTIIVGSYFDDTTAGVDAGSAYVFTSPPAMALNAITSYDAVAIALCLTGHVCGVGSAELSGNQLAAADVSGNCSLSPFDYFYVGLFVIDLNAGYTTGTRIDPPGPCATLPITTSLIKGDISGAGPLPFRNPTREMYSKAPSSYTVSLPSIVATPGLIEIPITVDDCFGVYSYDFQVTFDPAVLTPASPSFDTTGTLSNLPGLIQSNPNNPGHIIISGFQFTDFGQPMSGSGTFLKLRFNIVGSAGQSSALTFENYISDGPGSNVHEGFLFNEGFPSALVSNGSLTITAAPASISGAITYGNAIGNPVPPRFVKNVSVASTVGSPAVGPVITGTPGTYALTGFGAGSYTIKPTKPGGFNGAITSNDAARVAQGVSSAVPFVSLNQKFASDSSGNGTVSSNDAALIARFAAGLSGTGNVGQWKFFTADLPGPPTNPLPTPPYNDSRTYAAVMSSVTGEDYIGILIGEASGNYNPSTHPRPAGNGGQVTYDSGPVRGIAVELPQVTASAEKEIIIPVKVENIADKGVVSYEFNLRYDPLVMQPVGDAVDVKGTASRGLSVVTNANEPGLLRVVVYGAFPIDEDDVLLNLRFNAVGAAGSVSPISFERIMFNEGEAVVNVSDGRVALF